MEISSKSLDFILISLISKDSIDLFTLLQPIQKDKVVTL